MNKRKKGMAAIRRQLEEGYVKYHDARWIGSDPLKFVYDYTTNADREIVGLIAASLAYGNVTYINTSVSNALERMSFRPYDCLVASQEKELEHMSRGFRHRWTDETALADLLIGMKRMIQDHGGLGLSFAALDAPDQDIMQTLHAWVEQLRCGRPCKLLADPSRSSACKRLHLYVRWMVRDDCVDPGCWKGIAPARLMVPLDTHMYQFAVSCGFTRRKAADYKTVWEITEAFRKIAPEDPVKYDFSLTRPGIIEGWNP